MCTVTAHAVQRAQERWSIRGNLSRIIEEKHRESIVVGEWMEGETHMRLCLAPDGEHAMVENTDRETIVTVYSTKNTPIAQVIRDEVVDIHDKAIRKIDRQIKRTQRQHVLTIKQLSPQAEALDEQIAELEAKLSALQTERGVIRLQMNEPLEEIRDLQIKKKTIVKSKMHYM